MAEVGLVDVEARTADLLIAAAMAEVDTEDHLPTWAVVAGTSMLMLSL